MPVDINWWFNKKLKYFFDNKSHKKFKELQTNLLPPINSSIKSSLWLSNKYKSYKHKNISLAHAPRPYRKSLFHNIENEASDLFSEVRGKNFRTWRTPGIISDFIPRWLEYNGYAEIINSEFLYIESGSYNIKMELDLLKQKFGKIPFFCINDTCDDASISDKRLQIIRKTMEELLPNKSSFEI